MKMKQKERYNMIVIVEFMKVNFKLSYFRNHNSNPVRVKFVKHINAECWENMKIFAEFS